MTPFPEPELIDVDGMPLEVFTAGKPGGRGPLVLCHGFPELAYSWRLQIPVLKVALSDKNFFNRGGHPVRKLLNELALSAIGWTEKKAGQSFLIFCFPTSSILRKNMFRRD